MYGPQIMAEFYGKNHDGKPKKVPKNDPPTKWNGHWKDPKQGHSDWQTLHGPWPVPQCPPYDGPMDPPQDPVSTPLPPQKPLSPSSH